MNRTEFEAEIREAFARGYCAVRHPDVTTCDSCRDAAAERYPDGWAEWPRPTNERESSGRPVMHLTPPPAGANLARFIDENECAMLYMMSQTLLRSQISRSVCEREKRDHGPFVWSFKTQGPVLHHDAASQFVTDLYMAFRASQSSEEGRRLTE